MPLFDNYVQAPGGPVQTGTILNSLRGNIPDRNWIRLRQPFVDDYGRAYVILNDLKGGYTRNDSTGGEPKPLLRAYLINELRSMGFQLPAVCNAATLRKEDWIQLDRQVIRPARQRLQAAADLEAANSFGGFNAMGKMTLEYQAMSDPGEAFVDMDGRTDGRTDTPLFILRSLPLPITHSDFGFSSRELMVSRNSDTPLDTVMGEAAGRRVAERIEDEVIGMVTGITYGTVTSGPGAHTGTSTVYGYRTFPQRLTKTNFTVPTTTNGPTTYAEVLAALDQLYSQFFYGPFMLYHSTAWSQYMDSPFSTAGGNHPGETLRTMLKKIPAIQDVRRLDRLTGLTGGDAYTLLFVQMTPDVAQMVNGMDITTIQWEEKGGLDLRFKVMAIKVPRLRSDYNSRTGILHGTTA